MDQGLISHHISSNPREDKKTTHPFFSDGQSNIYGFDNEADTLDRYTKSDILKNVAQFNQYYSVGDSDVNVRQGYNRVAGRAAEAAEWGAMDGSRKGGAPNGRIDGVGESYIPSFHVNQTDEQEIYNSFSTDSVKGNFETTDFSRYYFSEQNVMNLQRQIKAEVYKLSKGSFVIDNQSENALKTVMRSYFLQYKMSNNKDVLSQIKVVNKKVINWCADNIFSNLLQYQQYKKDINTLPTEMTRPLNMSIKGRNTAFTGMSDRNRMH